MKTAAEIANHPKARLHRELVAILRAAGSAEGARQTWVRLRLNPRRWRRIINYGLGSNERQFQLNKIAFPDSNPVGVDAALNAGNNLNRLYELACGRASIVKDFGGQYKIGKKGLVILKHTTANQDRQVRPVLAQDN